VFLTRYGRVADFFLIYFLTTIGPAHYTYNIQLTKKIILMKYFCFKILQCSPYLRYSVFQYRYYCGYFGLYDLAGTPFKISRELFF
jgi:hypothetical protein